MHNTVKKVKIIKYSLRIRLLLSLFFLFFFLFLFFSFLLFLCCCFCCYYYCYYYYIIGILVTMTTTVSSSLVSTPHLHSLGSHCRHTWFLQHFPTSVAWWWQKLRSVDVMCLASTFHPAPHRHVHLHWITTRGLLFITSVFQCPWGVSLAEEKIIIKREFTETIGGWFCFSLALSLVAAGQEVVSATFFSSESHPTYLSLSLYIHLGLYSLFKSHEGLAWWFSHTPK